jgi:hypothetical protein
LDGAFPCGKPGNPWQMLLTRLDLEKAKMIIRDKVWVEFIDSMQESMDKFGRKFVWSELPQFKIWVMTALTVKRIPR